MGLSKAIYTLLLTAAVLFSALPTPVLAQETPELTMLQENFLGQKVNLRLNQAMGKALEACLCQMLSANSPAKASCQYNPEIQSFTRQFTNISGDPVYLQTSCQKLVEDVLQKPIQKQYQNMRIDLALSRPAIKDDNVLIVEYDADVGFKMQTHAQHIFSNILSEVKIAKLNPLTKIEQDTALIEFKRFRDDSCIKYFLVQDIPMPRKQMGLKLCSRLMKEDFRAVKASIMMDAENGPELLNLLKGIELHLKSARTEFHRDRLQSYVRTITRAPFLVMVTSANPSYEEWLRIVREQQDLSGDIASKVKALSKSYVVNEKQLFELAQLMGGVTPSTLKAVARNFPGIADWNAVYNNLNLKIAQANAKADSYIFLSSVGFTTACAALTRGWGSVACSAFLMAFFTGQDYLMYNSQLMDILVRIDKNTEQDDATSEVLLQKLEQFDSNKMMNAILMLTMFKGLNAGDKASLFHKFFGKP